MRDIILIAHNIRSCHNVGSLLRTADGLGLTKVFLTGYSPYPLSATDSRLPHVARKLDAQIHKTALGAEKTVPWEHLEDIFTLLPTLQAEGYSIIALEQAATSTPLPSFLPSARTALIVGREVEGVEPEVLAQCSHIVEIPMSGEKESFNVSAAAAMGLYHIAFIGNNR